MVRLPAGARQRADRARGPRRRSSARSSTRLGFEVAADWTATVPTWRARDVTREIDVVEEIARFRLDDVPFTLPRRTRDVRPADAGAAPAAHASRTCSSAPGFSEAYTWSLVPDDPGPGRDRAARAASPPSSASSARACSPSLVAPARHNADLGHENVALFEIARVYLPSGERLPDERWHVAGVVVDDSDEAAFFHAKGAVETLFAALKLAARFEPGPSGVGGAWKAAR